MAGAKLGELSDCLEVGNAVDNDEILQDESNFLEGQQLMQNYKNPDLNRCFVRNTCDKWLEVVFNQGSTPFVNQEEHTGGCVGKLPRAHNKYLVPPSSKLNKQKNMFKRDSKKGCGAVPVRDKTRRRGHAQTVSAVKLQRAKRKGSEPV